MSKMRWMFGGLVLAWLAGGVVAAAPQGLSGSAIWEQQCVRCHGKSGEGVKGKYDSALYGDWSVEKLARYIGDNMPDDDPGTCLGPDAEMVARYLHDTFYSREARARNHPPRVELVHLTNRQYVNTVADLLKSFTGADPVPGPERGLRGSYSREKPEPGVKKDFERVDPRIEFDFLREGTDPRPIPTNGLNVTWRGSVRADETGDYEFILRTPNGARLWVNDERTELIDASVASGKVDEHRARVRLLGGRVYPLRLEWFKRPKDKLASVALLWQPPHGAPGVIPARNLSPARTRSTFVVTTPFPPDDGSVGYERGVAVSRAWDEATTQAAIEAAQHVVQNLDRYLGVRPDATNRVGRAEAFGVNFLTAAFRRPLTDAQKRQWVTNWFDGSIPLEDAVKRVVLLGLKSPRFLYLGLADAAPDDHEVAARLSYGLWDSLPDRELTTLAGQGKLRTPEQVAAQAKRMLSDPRARAKALSFLHHWLQMDHIESLAKDARLFPGFTPEIIADLRTSLNLFLEDVVWSPSSDYRRLLLEDDLFVNQRLAKFYGVNTNATEDFIRVAVDPRERSGVVTHPYLLAAFSYPKSSSPIHRGVFLTRNIVGRALKSPPIAVAFKEADFAPDLTLREKISELTRPQACQACHSVINPLGFSLEHYDAVGRFRLEDGRRAINAVSEYVQDNGEKVRLTGGRDVARFAAGSEHAQNAFIEQLFHQVVKQPVLAYGSDVMRRLRQSFVDSGFNIQRLLVDIVTVSARHGTAGPATPASATAPPAGASQSSPNRVPNSNKS